MELQILEWPAEGQLLIAVISEDPSRQDAARESLKRYLRSGDLHRRVPITVQTCGFAGFPEEVAAVDTMRRLGARFAHAVNRLAFCIF